MQIDLSIKRPNHEVLYLNFNESPEEGKLQLYSKMTSFYAF